MSSNPVGWFEIYAQDIDRAKRFYESVFEVRLEKLEAPDGADMEMWAFRMQPDAPGSAGAIVRMDGFAPGGGGTLVYFICDDCAVEAKRAAANGGAIASEKSSIGTYGHIALVTDTEGNTIGLHSMQ